MRAALLPKRPAVYSPRPTTHAPASEEVSKYVKRREWCAEKEEDKETTRTHTYTHTHTYNTTRVTILPVRVARSTISEGLYFCWPIERAGEYAQNQPAAVETTTSQLTRPALIKILFSSSFEFVLMWHSFHFSSLLHQSALSFVPPPPFPSLCNSRTVRKNQPALSIGVVDTHRQALVWAQNGVRLVRARVDCILHDGQQRHCRCEKLKGKLWILQENRHHANVRA